MDMESANNTFEHIVADLPRDPADGAVLDKNMILTIAWEDSVQAAVVAAEEIGRADPDFREEARDSLAACIARMHHLEHEQGIEVIEAAEAILEGERLHGET